MYRSLLSASVLALSAGIASASVANPFTETFATDSSNWRNNDLVTPSTWVASGGPDGSGYITSVVDVDAAAFNFAIAARGHDSFDSSGDAFVGNWRTSGVTAFAFEMRHDAVAPVTPTIRFATPGNFPGAIGIQFAPALPNQWTTVTIAINPLSPQFVTFEGADFNTVFTNIGNVQIGFDTTGIAGFGSMVNFDIDNVRIVPAPGVLAVVPACLLLAGRRRRR